MRTILKVIAVILGILVIGIILGLSYLKLGLPNVGPAPDLKVESTPERLQRGKYLANNVMGCIDCHSDRNWDLFAAPVIPGTEGKGGEAFDQKMGFPGAYYARNITPDRLSKWTDGELFRAITTGVSRDGSALFPVMPYLNFGQMDEEDIYSIITYIRTLKPIEHKTPPSVSDFPVNFLINTMPQKAALKPKPPKSDLINYGRYLVTAASCADCHTNQEKGQVVGEPFAGGMKFPMPTGTAVSSNITPHTTGIGDWTEAQFVERFRYFSEQRFVPKKVASGEFQTIMPWTLYAGMHEDDLKAIFAYLKSLEPKENRITRFTASN